MFQEPIVIRSATHRIGSYPYLILVLTEYIEVYFL